MGRGSRGGGTCVVEFSEATCVVRPGWSGVVDAVGTLMLTREADSRGPQDDSRPDHDVGPAQRPGRDRRGDGHRAGARRLFLQHQGAPGLFGRAVRRRRSDGRAGGTHTRPPGRHARIGRRGDGQRPEPGDIWILNDPYTGGTHLPDITLVSPVDIDGAIVGYAVTRAHHSDIGGMSPGSMPADSTEIFQEGLIIRLRAVSPGASWWATWSTSSSPTYGCVAARGDLPGPGRRQRVAASDRRTRRPSRPATTGRRSTR